MRRRAQQGIARWLYVAPLALLALTAAAMGFSRTSSTQPQRTAEAQAGKARVAASESHTQAYGEPAADTNLRPTAPLAPYRVDMSQTDNVCSSGCPSPSPDESTAASLMPTPTPTPTGTGTGTPSPTPSATTLAPSHTPGMSFTTLHTSVTLDDNPLHGIIMAAPGLSQTDLTRTLVSLARLPQQQTILMLIVQKDQAAWIKGKVEAATAKLAGSTSSSFPFLRVRLYDVEQLRAALPQDKSSLAPAVHRYFLYPLIMEDLGALQENVAPATGSEGAAARAAVLFSNIEQPAVTPNATGTTSAPRLFPDAWLISDSRDVLFQRDPFPEFWTHAEQAWAQNNVTSMPSGGSHGTQAAVWQNTRSLPLVVAAGEANIMKLGQEDWNRGWVSMCYYDLGESMVSEGQIYCSGTTFATTSGLLLYLHEGMYPAMDLCMGLKDDKGVDQGIHNVIMHIPYPASKLQYWRECADVGGPFRPGGGKDPVMAHPHKLLDLVEGLQAKLHVRVANAEDGMICTMALLLRLPGGSDTNGDGQLLSVTEPRRTCAIVHQFDRQENLYWRWTQEYTWPQGE